MTAPPQPAVPQHMVALTRANRVRVARAELKRKIGTGERSVAGVIFQLPEEADTMTVFDLLLAQHRWGEHRVQEFLTAARLSESKTVGALSDRQRRKVVERLERGWA